MLRSWRVRVILWPYVLATHTGAAAGPQKSLEEDGDQPDDDDGDGGGVTTTGNYVADVGDDIDSCHHLGIGLIVSLLQQTRQRQNTTLTVTSQPILDTAPARS